MAEYNSFEQLKIENEEKFEPHRLQVKKNIESQKDLWSFLGELFELYIPKIIKTLF